MQKWIILALLLIFSTSSLANNSETARLSGWYVGAGAGLTGFSDGVLNDDDAFSRNVSKLDSQHSTLHMYGGYYVNRIVGIEVSYRHYGELTTAYEQPISTTFSPNAFSVSANVGYTFDTGIRAFGLAGLSSLQIKQSVDGWQDDQYLAFHYGVGGEYQPTFVHGLTLRIAYEADLYSAQINDIYNNPAQQDYDAYIAQISSLYVGIGYKF